MSGSRRNPTTWEEYQYGMSHRGSVSSDGNRSIRFDEQAHSPTESSALLDDDRSRRDSGNHHELRRRRSSITHRLTHLTHLGGVNSIENFARSWQRASAFHEIAPQRPSLLLTSESAERSDSDNDDFRRTDIEAGFRGGTSLLRAHLEAGSAPESAVVDDDATGDDRSGIHSENAGDERHGLGPHLSTVRSKDRALVDSAADDAPGPAHHHPHHPHLQHGSHHSGRQSIFAIAPHLATPLAGSYGTSYGTLRSTLNESSMEHAGQLWRQQQATGTSLPDGAREPLLVKEVEQDGRVVLAVAGQSTLPQTVFNSTNVLIGVGLLSLPLGIKYAGWLCGLGFLLLSALVTSYTANVLAKCMDADASLIGFSDLAYVSYGQKARIATSFLFTLELLAACVALVVLFGDTLDILFPGVGVVEFKILCGLVFVPLNFVPLKLLSYSSILGILCCFGIVTVVFVDGFLKSHTPGSLREPALTYIFPSNWLTLPLSFGLLMSPWGGHGVFPNIYRDMRHPYKFKRAVKITFSFTYILDVATAVAGILMFGDGVKDEITSNLIGNSGYPKIMSILMSIFIAIIPLTKAPLNARPIISTLESLSGLHVTSVSDSSSLVGLSGYARGFLKIGIRIIVVVIVVLIAIVVPAFDSIMAFMGSAMCFTICVILPLMFHLKLFGKEISTRERLLNYFLITISSILAVVGTMWAFLPKSMIGAE